MSLLTAHPAGAPGTAAAGAAASSAPAGAFRGALSVVELQLRQEVAVTPGSFSREVQGVTTSQLRLRGDVCWVGWVLPLRLGHVDLGAVLSCKARGSS